MTIDDLTQTRIYQTKLSMRFPVDEDSTKRLRAVIVFNAQPLPWYRSLLRWFKRVS